MLITRQTTAKRLTFISLGALLIGHLMVPPIIALNIAGIILVSIFVFFFTLRKNDVFSFIMVIYFCSLFPYLTGYGGGFNLVAFFNILFFSVYRRRLPNENILNNKWLVFLTVIFIMSSLLGWFTNYLGNIFHLLFSIASFMGVLSLLLTSSRLLITNARIKIFIQLNFILIIYSSIASLNKFLKVITFNTPMMPTSIYDNSGNVLEGSGIIGSSPLYGEHSMILVALFTIFLIFGRKKYGSNLMLVTGVLLSFINVFMSVSRSAFLLSLAGVVSIIIFQYKVNTINISKQINQIALIAFLAAGMLFFVNVTGLNYVFERVNDYEVANKAEGGLSITKITDGSALGRKEAFDEGYKRYDSRNNWLIGFGWGTREENRLAFYVDPTIKQDAVHTQIFAILFLFGWIGAIAYLALYIYIIRKSYNLSGYNSQWLYGNRLFAYFSFIMLILFLFNELKVDSISYQSYFGSTIIFLGLAYANLNTVKHLRNSTKHNKLI